MPISRVEGLPVESFAHLVRFLTVERTRLVWLYAEAVRLRQDGRNHQCDRLRAVEKVLLVPLASARRKARLGRVDEQELEALKENFGISQDWILHGDVAALKAGIEAHCQAGQEDRVPRRIPASG